MTQEDALLRLARIRRARADLDGALTALGRREDAAVHDARRWGLSWEQIAVALGRTRSSVWERHHAQADS